MKNNFTKEGNMKRKVDDISLILNTSDRVTLSVTIVFIVISLIIAVINVEGIRKKEIDEIEKYLSVRTIEGAEKVDAYFSNKLTELELIASFQEIYTMDWEKQYPILKYNAQKLRYSDLFVIDNNGIGYYSEDNAKRNQKEEQFFYNINKNEQYITEPFSQVGRGKAITTLSTAIYNDGNRVGTLCGTINLDYLYEYIKYDTVKESEYGFIINQNGQYVANNDLSLVYDKVNIFEQDGYEVEFLKNQEKNNYGSIKGDGKE